MAGPTNAQIVTAPLEGKTADYVRAACELQGCTCGDALRMTVKSIADDDRPESAKGYAKASEVDITHRMDCPLLLATGRN